MVFGFGFLQSRAIEAVEMIPALFEKGLGFEAKVTENRRTSENNFNG